MIEIEMNNITKRFPGVKALNNVSIKVEKGTVHALVGENGAGKSTLIKVLSGAYKADGGSLVIEGKEIAEHTPSAMINEGVAVIYQELMLVEHKTVAENIFLGRQPLNSMRIIDYKKMNKDAEKILKSLYLNVSPSDMVYSLSVAKRQMVEISKAMSRNAKIIVLDEPTAVLSDTELVELFKLVKALACKGITFLYISHRIPEIFELCNNLTIMKDGCVVETGKVEDYSREKLVSLMVGRNMGNIYPDNSNRIIGTKVLEVKNLSNRHFENVCFTLHKGEILGIAGLVGSGRTEILMAIFGADIIDSGVIYYEGKEVVFHNPKEAIKNGFGMVSEDRKESGLFLQQSMMFNTSIVALDKFIKGKIINLSNERNNTKKYIKMLNIKPNNENIVINNMSGGNQQKVVLAKWLTTQCKILLVDEPTRGIDVGAKQEIYNLLEHLVENGLSVIIVSSELSEILGICDRVIVMNEGCIEGEKIISETSEEELLSLAT